MLIILLSIFYFERGANQGDPIQTYISFFVLEVSFLCLETKKKSIFLIFFFFWYTAYADDIKFFIENKKSIEVWSLNHLLTPICGKNDNYRPV